MTNLIQEYRINPPSAYVNNHFNLCPSIIVNSINNIAPDWDAIIDFGCGHGIKALSIALMFPDRKVIGVDITDAFEEATKFAKRQLKLAGLPNNLFFKKISPGQSLTTIVADSVSAIYSWSVFEHVSKEVLPAVVVDMYQVLSENGVVFFQVAPLFFSPFGSHLREFVSKPWAHLELSHAELRKKVEIDDGNISRRKWMFSRYEELNKVTAQELLGYFLESNFFIAKNKLNTVSLSPPEELVRIYGKTLLTTNEIVCMAQKKQIHKRSLFSFINKADVS